jgi:2-methylisocitrate lyase-like PEP mutase family enzyme
VTSPGERRPEGDRDVSSAPLQELIADGGPILTPGVFDALSARMVEAAGFPAVFLTGYGTAAALFGLPDIGLITMSETVANARRLAAVVGVPMIADADTGYGGPTHVARTVRELMAAGVAAVQIEDKVWPKSGPGSASAVISPEEMVEKVEAAVAARASGSCLIVARTDALPAEGTDAAVARGQLYARHGADIVFVNELKSLPDIEACAHALDGCPLVYNWRSDWEPEHLTPSRLGELGYRIILFPLATLIGAWRGMSAVLEEMNRAGGQPPLERASVNALARFLAVPSWTSRR